MTYVDWRQMALPVESHRAYYRARAHPRVPGGQPKGAPRGRCEEGSRWTRFALRPGDMGKRIVVRPGELLVEGELRTNIDGGFAKNGLRSPGCSNEEHVLGNPRSARPCVRTPPRRVRRPLPPVLPHLLLESGPGQGGEDCSDGGWPALAQQSYQGYICRADDDVGGIVQLSKSINCAGPEFLPNPAIFLSDAGLSTPADEKLFVGAAAPGVRVLLRDMPSCKRFVRFAGDPAPIYAADDPRLALVANTVEEPAADKSTSMCMTVPMTFLNEEGCKLSPACSAAGQRAADGESRMVRLDAATRAIFHQEGRYIFEVRDLRPTESPCARRGVGGAVGQVVAGHHRRTLRQRQAGRRRGGGRGEVRAHPC